MISFPQPVGIKIAPSILSKAEELRAHLAKLEIRELVLHTGAELDGKTGEISIHFKGKLVRAAYPELMFYNSDGIQLSGFVQLELLYYFFTADGEAPTGEFISFSELPGGRVYDQAFQGYTGNQVAKVFGDDVEAFRVACTVVGGEPYDFADATYQIRILPKLPIRMVYWLGDEEFPSACQFLFDSTATHYYPIEGLAILGSELAQRVIKNKST